MDDAQLPLRLFSAVSTVGAISEVVVFGDSYEDNGTSLRLSEAAVRARIPGSQSLPVAPRNHRYWRGRWSNGPTMVEILARRLNVPLIDYATGGAKSGDGNYDAWLDYYANSGLRGQIESYRSSLTETELDPRALYIVSASTNDYLQFHDFRQPGNLPVGTAPPITYEALAEQAASNVCEGVSHLVSIGARHVVVFSAYPISRSPLAIFEDPQKGEAERFTRRFDESLARRLNHIDTETTRVVVFPIGELMLDVMNHPTHFSIANTSTACQPAVNGASGHCHSPASYIWWDDIHPTAKMHEILAQSLYEIVVRPSLVH